MKSWMLTSLTTVTFFAVISAPAELHAAPHKPDIITFDAPGAGVGAFQGTGCFGCTFAINEQGAIAGTYSDANNVSHGFVRSRAGTFITINYPGAAQTVAQSINDVGEITGFYIDAAGNQHGFVRSAHGLFTTFDAPDGENGTEPLFINLEGAVVGYALDTNLLFHAFLRRADGTIVDFLGPRSCTSGISAGCYGSEATYVDLFGASVGNFEDNTANLVSHGLLRSPGGQLARFDVPGAGTGLYQGTGCPGCNMGVNYLGTIAGTYTDGSNVFHGFVRNVIGQFTTFDAPGAGAGLYQGTGCYSDCPVSINDLETVTGSYIDSNSVQHGYVRNPNGSFVTIDPPGSIDTQPERINDSGLIVGYYLDGNFVSHGFLVLSW